LRRRSKIRISAGGTILSLIDPGIQEYTELLSLHSIDELRRVFWSERSVDIGAMVTLEKLLDLDEKVIPRGLRQAAGSIADPQIRSLATLGGNIFAGNSYLGLLGFLPLHDARFELRRYNGTRWIGANRFFDDEGRPTIAPGEILTRVRIPLGRWNIQKVQRLEIGSDIREGEFMFCAIAGVRSNSIEDLRIGISVPGLGLIQERQLDAQVVGRGLPLSLKDIDYYRSEFTQGLGLPEKLRVPFVLDRIGNLAAAYLLSLGHESRG